MGELRANVLFRDGRCVASLLDGHHICADRWGEEHRPDDLDRLTLEHVREHPGGMRRDEPGWCLTLCFAANMAHWSSANPVAARSYLAGVRREASHH